VDNDGAMISPIPASTSRPAAGLGGRIVLTLFFLVFFGMGAVFVVLIARESLSNLRTWTWTRTECQILRSGISETDRRRNRTGDFQVDVRYEYTFGGQTFTSDKLSPRPVFYQDYGKAERLAGKFQVGARQFCYVHSKTPGEAVLQRGNLLFPFFVLFPLIFVTIGAIGIYSAWRPASLGLAGTKPISDRARGATSERLGMGVFALFTLVGLVVFFFFSLRMGWQVLSARNWPAVTCAVLSSEVRSHRGDHGSTYSVDILYSYHIDGREYKANRYGFMGGSSSGYSGKQAIVSRYPPGTQTACYVDPNDPTNAVLERGFTPIMLIGLLPLAFVGFGVGGFVSMRRKARLSALGSTSTNFGFVSSGAVVPSMGVNESNAAVELRPATSSLSKFVVGVLIGLFWNGVVSVFLFQLFHGGRAGHFEWFLALFLIPFVLIGLGLIVMVGYFFLSMFNPCPWITLMPGAPRLGDSVRLEWRVKGRVEVLKDLRLIVQGREEATYSRGTRSSTDRNVFAEFPVTTITNSRDMSSGAAQFEIPGELMHSFSSRHNKIVWCIQVKGEIARWPDLDEEFPLTVLPGVATEGRQI
jgi:hypothetical protein